MYTRMLVPVDGSKTAENVLPYARAFARSLKIPVELLAVIDITELTAKLARERIAHFDTLLQDTARRTEDYLKQIARTFSATTVTCSVENGTPEEVIIERAAVDRGTLVTMATHGRSGLDRWLLGSVAEKVLRGTSNPLLLVTASEEAKTEGEATVKSIIVPLDGSELAESVLPTAAELAKRLNLEIILFRAYNIPYNAYATAEGYYAIDYDELLTSMRDEAVEYLEKKTEAIKKLGVAKVSYVAREGFAADEIISLGRETPDNLIAMCTHGRSGVKRWVLGSVTETVVRHSGDPVLVIRAG